MVNVNTSSIDSAASRAAQQATAQISAVSRAKAANGETQLSVESVKAIQDGALPPIINSRKDEPNLDAEQNAADKATNETGKTRQAETQISEAEVAANVETVNATLTSSKEVGNIVDIQA